MQLCALGIQDLHELLQALAACDHVHRIAADLDDQLLRDDDPQPQSGTEGVPPEVAIPIESSPRHALMELDHQPQGVQGDAPGDHQCQRPRTPATIETRLSY